MDFYATVKQVRQYLGISQEELAHALNVSYVTINRWENGKSEPNRLAKSVFFSFCSKKGIVIKEEPNLHYDHKKGGKINNYQLSMDEKRKARKTNS